MAEPDATEDKKYLFDNPANVRRLVWALVAACVIAFLADFVVYRYVDHPWENLFGFYAIYGFVACIVLVLGAKGLRKLLQRRETFYDD